MTLDQKTVTYVTVFWWIFVVKGSDGRSGASLAVQIKIEIHLFHSLEVGVVLMFVNAQNLAVLADQL